MKISEREAGVYCPHCQNKALHRIVYVNNKIQSVACESCQRFTGVKRDWKKELYREVCGRVSTKPSRIKKECRRNVGQFVSSMPLRMISKPYRLLDYMSKTRKVWKKSESAMFKAAAEK